MSKNTFKKRNNVNLVVIGTLPPPLGGTTVLFKQLVDELCHREDVDVTVVNTNWTGPWPFGIVVRILRTLFFTFRAARRADIVTFHLNRPVMAVPIILISKFRKKPVILRWFGGADYHTSGGKFRRYFVQWGIRRADMTLLETKKLVDLARMDGAIDARWYSNSRPLLDFPPRKAVACSRFVFLGHIRKVKGIEEILSLDEKLSDVGSVSLYGPLTDGYTCDTFVGYKNISYFGEIESEHVVETLLEYDALILPTYHDGEGYPGVILEAFMAGIPVITTKWLSIPEIVDESCGILIEPKNSNSLLSAMKRLVDDSTLYILLCQGARAKRVSFSSNHWGQVFVEYCNELANNKNKKAPGVQV